MKITLRLISALLLVTALGAGLLSFLQARSEKRRLSLELERRTAVLAAGLKESLAWLPKGGGADSRRQLLANFVNRERLLGVIIYDGNGRILQETPGLLQELRRPSPRIAEAAAGSGGRGGFEQAGAAQVYLYAVPLRVEDRPAALVLLHDAGFIDRRLEGIWRSNFLRLLILAVLIAVTTLLVVRWSITAPVAQLAGWIKDLRLGTNGRAYAQPRGDILGPLAAEVQKMATSLEAARAAAEKEAQLRLAGESLWTPEKLKEHVRNRLGDKTLYVVSSREPYMHIRQKAKVECIVPASGLVTAMDPILRACGGLWLAHGAGDADRESCDADDKVRVPPESPAYTLKRIWLSPDEEEGYYYGFSNEGLWPLCHITHTRPTFRLKDWISYQQVNQKFADALLVEIENEESPLILIQDYHFALLPLLIREKRPDARIILFWHIPWPNPESFGICPWKQEILLGMLGADIIGFHIQYHCNHFLDTVDDTLESRVNWENFSVLRGGRVTQVRPFPISVGGFAPAGSAPDPEAAHLQKLLCKETIYKKYGAAVRRIGVGVDRLDYTKGIVERFRAIERLFEKHPEHAGRFSFFELGAPSRAHIPKYHDFIDEVEKTAEAVNAKFQSREWKPIHFLKGHHSHADILPFYKAADLCLVTSLHDGMNLVAKEFVAARDDEDGVLILSKFTGASRELKESLIVNPYDVENTAEAVHLALEMEPAERKRRMRQMRKMVQNRNIYRWAANLIGAITQLPAPREKAEAAAGSAPI